MSAREPNANQSSKSSKHSISRKAFFECLDNIKKEILDGIHYQNQCLEREFAILIEDFKRDFIRKLKQDEEAIRAEFLNQNKESNDYKEIDNSFISNSNQLRPNLYQYDYDTSNDIDYKEIHNYFNTYSNQLQPILSEYDPEQYSFKPNYCQYFKKSFSCIFPHSKY
ncbi:hypothetical protein TVAG_475300 [Trichomonas vaginalis G3]|uniref:Uncharacterized protein n=1 Tax=Trichomonas vaginalis (strain ATCC PRA-98 / G3) TaxID=412133 RepID=A2EM37_TRIV3|nr:hypothetical protein TVAGG3_0613610 [Trichomonas vaginalis G3]EAY06296.1 hypothetical protein TVAG_475300 [Trichomonas vaginalis G3]KAI5503374.1 hypothetical protein TVAGG3_0613610 [Trichomonas vaginalis G3]|eukprot:XP_001318519.1 hypothetical protein [Trichomonas vaginalis G3]